ncbi:hypothetical protein CJJ23_00025 [Mycoplasmopsis agassizii]|uniref:Uncharacterized protein n=1 Tax=Mycoplasmopsis agassizii TaxID=33922 RepID=A0A269TKN8_9BACT|nr:hypothetical protein [Mycoplasmopsis agassizii]PAK21720.1 hypothetical protein CJJ23_00025 [Mycoplasmopsis agassizii]
MKANNIYKDWNSLSKKISPILKEYSDLELDVVSDENGGLICTIKAYKLKTKGGGTMTVEQLAKIVLDGFARIESVIGVMQADINQLKNDVGRIDKTTQVLQKDMVEVKSDVARIDGNVNELQKDMVEVKSDIARIDKTVNELQKDVKRIDKTVNELQNDVKRIDSVLEKNNIK